ncbi:XcyI family restriction endonuclease [Corynebacterium cystitidis]|uniref:XcyI family restriction endonuclease n=1 Tax=Corynebacterium cystitidis TaxID=35757 RepID=UPI00211F282B|nr:XcyI family restriction endonuclease [Corynebacterium cystitidis]
MERFKFPPPGRQVYLAEFLSKVREEGGLHDSVRKAARSVDADLLRKEMKAYAPKEGLQVLQGSEVRDEEVFVVPSVLRKSPGSLAYYRLLLGVSQKQFYTVKSGTNIFKPLEFRGEITEEASDNLEEFCKAMNTAMVKLILALPKVNLRDDVDQLPLLTLGAQADGSWRVQIGSKATKDVFNTLKQIVIDQEIPYSETDISITVWNRSGREVTLALAPDPDVVIREDFHDENVYKVAIEIKGGRDYANLHNRVGEAEKSHQKARNNGAQDCWTIISLEKADLDVIKEESPTTREWLDIDEVRNQEGPSWSRLVTLTLSSMGI